MKVNNVLFCFFYKNSGYYNRSIVFFPKIKNMNAMYVTENVK